MVKAIQRIELNTFSDAPMHCPFCGTRTFDDASVVTPCAHTLFVAHDEGFEYRSDRFNANLEIEGLSDAEVEVRCGEDERGMDGFTSRVTLADAIKMAAYIGPASGFGSYYGFAPE